ncbi:zinc knuckle [Colletotrichum orchidophilum]|uniref:Zinc knuckle n=1 Tax=Colletotrichum orchidophilum TaxID=1209926 RepID=A0A1G4B2G3_9PEZI|nr:zinc knuckle [Colletotrichum orchidophilum]OHE95546.1 zinc knuckle [Colletotrichum orchidophilum]
MEMLEQAEAVPVLSTEEEVQRITKKRSLEDVEQGDAMPNGSPQSHRASSHEPEAKRARTEQIQQSPAQALTKHSESVDEGELEEDGEVPPSEPESENQAIVAEQSDGSVGSRTRSKASASGGESDVGSNRTTRSMSAAASGPSHVGWNQGITSQIRTSLGGPKTKAAPAPAKASITEEEAAPALISQEVPAPTEAAEPAQPAQLGPKEGKLSRQQRRAEAATIEKEKAQELQKSPFVYAPGLTFLQPNKKTLLAPKGNNLGRGVWKAKFKSWCQSFVSRNNDQAHLLTPDIVVAALQDYIAVRAHWIKKKHSGAAATEARKPETKNDIAVNLAAILKNDSFLPGSEQSPLIIHDNDDVVDDDVQEVRPPSGGAAMARRPSQTENIANDQHSATTQPQNDVADEDGEMEAGQSEPGPALMTEEEDLAQQRKYFPGLADSVQICVYCASLGHTSMACPKTRCKFCEHLHHFSWNCPTRERCTKCRQLGHGKAQCKEKLIHLDEEGMECATCGSQEHQEADCERIWRSYKPPTNIKKVKPFPAFCAFCGTESHYSSDCHLNRDRPKSETWTLKNRHLYVDKNATDGPISDFASQPQNPKFAPLQIKGSAAKRNHIFYPDSDGSEEGEFIGQKVKPRAPLGNIQMSTNLQINTGNFGPPPQTRSNGRGQQRNGWSAQPPLPPGPPPPGPPPQGSYSRMSRSYNNQSRQPANGLPPKPPAPQSQQHGHSSAGPPSNGRGPNPPKKQRTRNQSGNSNAGAAQQQNGGVPASRRRGKNRRGGKQG